MCGEDEAYKHIPGAVPATLPPKPLLPNWGVVNMTPYYVDIQVRLPLLSLKKKNIGAHWLCIVLYCIR